MTVEPRPFRLAVPDAELEDLRARLRRTRWPEKETVADWSQGIPLATVRDVADHWLHRYDWRRCEAEINRWPGVLVEVDGVDIHALHIRSDNPDAWPLVMTHGWPGSLIEFLDVIEPLRADFHLVIPSLPGYGFSAKPAETGWDVERIAAAWDQLMRALGYERYYAQGGDWGAIVTSSIGAQALGACAGIHVNMPVVRPTPALLADMDEGEQAAMARLAWYQEQEAGYSTEQATKPQTIGYALSDSPVGQLAWVLEKFHGWTDCGGDPESVISRDRLLDNVMLYWLGNAGASSARLYWHSFRTGNSAPVTVPSGASQFPKEIIRLSRRWAETRYTDIVYWNEAANGGHFAAMEQPALFVAELRAWKAAMAAAGHGM